ncbi:hypothetical protein MAR_027285, partial [Mya arenaria]
MLWASVTGPTLKFKPLPKINLLTTIGWTTIPQMHNDCSTPITQGLFFSKLATESYNQCHLLHAQYGPPHVTDKAARWPGSTHDSIMTVSRIQNIMERGLPGNGYNYMLGESGNGCKKWLLTPYHRKVDQHQDAYNGAHKTTRYAVGRGIWQLNMFCTVISAFTLTRR